MRNPIVSFLRGMWASVKDRSRKARPVAGGDVVIHDPAAQKPHNLDDPFYDATIQERVGKVIASSTRPPSDSPKPPPKSD